MQRSLCHRCGHVPLWAPGRHTRRRFPTDTYLEHCASVLSSRASLARQEAMDTLLVLKRMLVPCVGGEVGKIVRNEPGAWSKVLRRYAREAFVLVQRPNQKCRALTTGDRAVVKVASRWYDLRPSRSAGADREFAVCRWFL